MYIFKAHIANSGEFCSFKMCNFKTHIINSEEFLYFNKKEEAPKILLDIRNNAV